MQCRMLPCPSMWTTAPPHISNRFVLLQSHILVCFIAFCPDAVELIVQNLHCTLYGDKSSIPSQSAIWMGHAHICTCTHPPLHSTAYSVCFIMLLTLSSKVIVDGLP